MWFNTPHEIIFQVGFWYKKEKDEAYYHVDAEWDPYLFSLTVWWWEDGGIEEMISPFTIEDLTSWNIDYDLLPQVLKDEIRKITRLTYLAIEKENPRELSKLNIEDQLVIFQVDEPMAPRTLQ